MHFLTKFACFLPLWVLLTSFSDALPAQPTGTLSVDYSHVQVTEGQVHGVAGNGLIQFKGIPYAAPPVGELRWRAPQSPAKYSHVFHANQFGNRCFQAPEMPGRKVEAYVQPQSEDCLYLNIYRPDSTAKNLPVMVWIPGGGLVSGSGARPVNWGGNLAKKDVVVVSINYRLGRLGFFAHPELSAENPDQGRLFNYGLMDQIEALNWVKRNIASFGGDADNITIFGESAGGASAMALVASPQSKGLFKRVIIQSGYGLRINDVVREFAENKALAVERTGEELASRLNMPQASLAQLRAQSPEAIVAATNFSQFIWFAVDGVVIPRPLKDIYQAAEQNAVAMMIGTNDAESTLGPPTAQLSALKQYLPDETLDAMTPAFGSEVQRNTFLLSDYSFHSQARALINWLAAQDIPVYHYRFAMPGLLSREQQLNGEKIYGALHAGELPYVFGNFTGDHFENEKPSPRERQVSEQMMMFWTNFAKTGSPNGEGIPEWQSGERGMLMHISPDGTKNVEDSWRSRLEKLNALTGL